MDIKLPHPLSELFKTVPAEALPKVGTKPYHLLKILADGGLHERSNLVKDPILGESLRDPLERLRHDKLSNWNVLSIPIPNSKSKALQLDPRHLSGDPAQDAAARREMKNRVKKKSHKDAENGRKREAQAFREMTEAQKEYVAGLGEAANDADIKKPLSD